MSGLNRREFLKLAGAAGLGTLLSGAPRVMRALKRSQAGRPNIIVLVFDTMSASNLSVYGYPRATTPNLEKIAQRATVYHSHISAASFTTPGTASLLMGMYPWTHRAINQAGLIRRELLASSLFHAIGKDYYRLGFAQNLAADLLLGQFHPEIERHLPLTFCSLRSDTLLGEHFTNDRTMASGAFEDFLFDLKVSPGLTGSLFFGLGYKSYFLNREDLYRYGYEQYPLGLPIRKDISLSFLNEVVYDGLRDELLSLHHNQTPFFAYVHLWSPHEPYRPRKDYLRLFTGDGYNPVDKPDAPLGGDGFTSKELRQLRNNYDRYIANVDAEIGRFFDSLESQGVLDNTYIVLTSDHGQLFERGVHGHISPYLYEPGIRIPLVISAPGQKARQDIHTLTSSVDILPTLLHLAGRDIPADCEGQILPGFGGPEDPGRSIFAVEAKKDSAFGPLKLATFAMYKEAYKLIYYTGYPGSDDIFELYDLQNDVDELDNLASRHAVTLKRYKDELLSALDRSNRALQ